MRTIIEVPDALIKTLDHIGERQHKSRAALIREAIVVYLDRKAPIGSDESAFGLWEKRGVDGLEYQERIRCEWNAL